LDCSIKKTGSPLKNERGIALVTITLIIILVTAIIAMALNISEIEINLASTNRRTTQGFHAAESGAELSIPVIQDTLDQNAIPTYASSGVVVDPRNVIGSTSIPDFVEELASGVGSLNDSAKSNPNITITSISGQTVQVDVDYEGPVDLAGSEFQDFAIGYHRKTGGTGCASGTLYYIDSLANGPVKTQSDVGSAYFNCS
jgi:Tfp pilus assembly protein PilX